MIKIFKFPCKKQLDGSSSKILISYSFIIEYLKYVLLYSAV